MAKRRIGVFFPDPYQYEEELEGSAEDLQPTDKEIEQEKIKKNNHFCISFNYKTKTFVSLHDLTLKKAFNTYNNCYSYYGNFINIFNPHIEGTGFIPSLTSQENKVDSVRAIAFKRYLIYGDATEYSAIINNKLTTDDKDATSYNLYEIAVVVQALNNKLELLDSVNYKIRRINNTIVPTTTSNEYKIDKIDGMPPVQSLCVDTDLCASNDVIRSLLGGNDYHTQNTPTNYKKALYKLGRWYVNYFRNILPPHTDYFVPDVTEEMNVYKYPRDTDILDKRGLDSDDNSLIYGNYFVLRFRLGCIAYQSVGLKITPKLIAQPIKVEDININTKEY